MTKMKKNLIALAMTVTIVTGVTGALSASAATMRFGDVSEGHWAQSDITNMAEMQVMTGYNDGNFHPNAWMSRPEFTNMTLKTLGLTPGQLGRIPVLESVSTNYWKFGEVDNAAWISTYPSGVFRPENPVRRVEVMTGLSAMVNKPLVSSEEAERILANYQDGAQVPTGVRREVATALQADLIEMDPQFGTTMLHPMRPVTRAETAAMLNNLYESRDTAIARNGVFVSGYQPRTIAGVTDTGASAVYGYEEKDRGPWWSGTRTPYRNSADTVTDARDVKLLPVAKNNQGSVLSLAPNTVFTGTVAKAVYSEFNRVGDPVVLILDHPLMDTANRIVAPAGSRVIGNVSNVVSNNRSGDIAQLGIHFTSIITPIGERLPINATIANTDGIIKADAMQGVVVHPQRSTTALQREISTAQGALYGTKVGKAQVLDTPFVTLGSSQTVTGVDPRLTSNIVLGVGDRLQVRLGSPSTTPASE